MIFPSSANDAARRSDVNGLLRTPASRRADRKRNRDRRASGYANWAARSDAAASITGRRSSIRCSVEGISLTRSDNPVPRLCQTRSTAKTTPAGAETAPAPASPTRAPDSSRTPAQKPDRVAHHREKQHSSHAARVPSDWRTVQVPTAPPEDGVIKDIICPRALGTGGTLRGGMTSATARRPVRRELRLVIQARTLRLRLRGSSPMLPGQILVKDTCRTATTNGKGAD
jgi:hypothetical protein